MYQPQDINGGPPFSPRNTNPLIPTYIVKDEDNKSIIIGKILGNAPKQHVNTEVTPINKIGV